MNRAEKLILAIETTQNQGSLAVLAKDRSVFSVEWNRSRSHSEFINQKLSECLTSAGTSLKSIEKILLSCGPGSFTGVRVGLNVAKTISYLQKIPVVPIDSVELQARQMTKNGTVSSMIYGFRDIVYCGIWKKQEAQWTCVEKTRSMTFEEALLLCKDVDAITGNIDTFFKLETDVKERLLGSRAGAKELLEMTSQDLYPAFSWEELDVNYVRDSEPEEKLKSRN